MTTLTGSIPACAGEASLSAMMRQPSTVYPRVCGGSNPGLGLPPAGRGLSPRVRGKPNAAQHQAGYRRSIPECAGEARAG